MATSTAQVLTSTWVQIGTSGDKIMLQCTTGWPVMWALSAAQPAGSVVGPILGLRDYLRIDLTENLWVRAEQAEATVSKTLIV